MQWNVGMELGGAWARMVVRGRGVCLRQMALAAFREGKFLCFGEEAEALAGRELPGTQVLSAMCGEQILNDAALSACLTKMLEASGLGGIGNRARVLMARPAGMQPGAMKRLVGSVMQAGAGACALIRSDLAGAIGAGIPVLSPQGHLLLEIGETHLSASLISFGRVCGFASVPWGLNQADEEIRRLLTLRYDLRCGRRSVRRLREAVSSAIAANDDLPEAVAGLSYTTGFPALAAVPVGQLRAAIEPAIHTLLHLAEAVIRELPDELASDLNETGVTVIGGGANLFGLDRLLSEGLNLTCHVPQDPQDAMIRGLERALEGGADIESMVEASQTVLEKTVI